MKNLLYLALFISVTFTLVSCSSQVTSSKGKTQLTKEEKSITPLFTVSSSSPSVEPAIRTFWTVQTSVIRDGGPELGSISMRKEYSSMVLDNTAYPHPNSFNFYLEVKAGSDSGKGRVIDSFRMMEGTYEIHETKIILSVTKILGQDHVGDVIIGGTPGSDNPVNIVVGMTRDADNMILLFPTFIKDTANIPPFNDDMIVHFERSFLSK